MHEMTLFTTLHSLKLEYTDNEGDWITDEELDAFEERARQVMPFIKTLNI